MSAESLSKSLASYFPGVEPPITTSHVKIEEIKVRNRTDKKIERKVVVIEMTP